MSAAICAALWASNSFCVILPFHEKTRCQMGRRPSDSGHKSGEPDAIELYAWLRLLNQHARIIFKTANQCCKMWCLCDLISQIVSHLETRPLEQRFLPRQKISFRRLWFRFFTFPARTTRKRRHMTINAPADVAFAPILSCWHVLPTIARQA